MRNNTLLGNKGEILFMQYVGDKTRLLFHDNYIEGNNAHFGNGAFILYGTLYNVGSFNFDLERNVIVNNTAQSLLKFAPYNWHNPSRSMRLRLEYNVFENNNFATSIDLSQNIY
ncbi:unnamed protein product, partial [Owenia fusiformis]